MLELARECDWIDVKRLSVQIHDLHAAWRPDIYYHSDEPYTKETFLNDIENRLIYVCKLDNQIVGYVIVSIQHKGGPGTHKVRLLRLDCICVDKGYRGQGIGKAMMADVKALAKAFGCKKIILGVHPENDGAMIFYQKSGFHIRTINLDLTL